MDDRALVRVRLDALAVRVDEDLEHLRGLLADGAARPRPGLVDGHAVAALHDGVTDACCALLVGSIPTEHDVRRVVAVASVATELDHVAALTRRVAVLVASDDGPPVDPACHDILQVMADEAVDRYRGVLRAWAAADAALAAGSTGPSGALEVASTSLTTFLVGLRGPGAVGTVRRVEATARALDRIVDHTRALANHLAPLLALDAGHLAARAR